MMRPTCPPILFFPRRSQDFPRRGLLLGALLLGVPLGRAAARDVTLFEGPPGGVGSVVVLDETGARPPVRPAALQGIRLLPVDCTGRTYLERLSPARPRLATDVPGASRVLLPHGLGALLRYRRDGAAGATFGLARVDPSGVATSLWEHPGAGATGTDDPFPARLAIAPAGDALLVLTSFDAGGDALEIELATGTVKNHTASLPAQDFADGGACLLPTWGLACTPQGILRFGRGAAAQATAVPFPAGTAWHAGSVAPSADGSSVAAVAGPLASAAHVYVFGRSGAVVQVSTTPMTLSGAGYLPDAPSGPFLALSPDGSTCVWRSDGLTKEAFVRQVVAPAGTPSVQLTSDAHFDDTLDNTADFLFLSPTRLILAVGELDPQIPDAIDKGDLFQVDLQAGGLMAFRNVTNTSGDTRFPFTAPGALKTEEGYARVPGTPRFLAYRDGSSGQGELLEARAGRTGSTVLLDDVKSIDLWQAVGPRVVLSMRRDSSDTRELWSWSSGALARLARLDDAFDVLRPATDGVDRFGAIVQNGPFEWLVRADLASGRLELFLSAAFTFGPALDFAPDGSLVSSIDLAPGASVVGAWPAAGGGRLLAQGGPAFVLAPD